MSVDGIQAWTMWAIATVVVAAVSLVGGIEADPALANETVWSCGLTDTGGTSSVWEPKSVDGLSTTNKCRTGVGLDINAPGNTVQRSQSADWQAIAPAGLTIVLVYVPPGGLNATNINDGDSWFGGGFFWSGGGGQINDSNNTKGFGASGLSTNHVGFQVVCGANPCSGVLGRADLAVNDIGLQLQETQGPWISAPSGLWQSSGWIRSSWPLQFTGDSPSGICGLAATLSGQLVVLKGFPQNDTTWHQCNAAGLGGASVTVDTTKFPDGQNSLTLHGSDAAGLSTLDASYTRTLYIDNQTPSIAFSGPTDALSTAGTQYITASGAAGPSGVSGVGCSLDNAPSVWYPQSSVSLPVSGVGVHHLTCYAGNNARDALGHVATSDPTTWTLSIREPSVSTVAFSKVVDALRCRSRRESVRIPARWVTGRSHGQPVRVKVPAQTRTIKVVRCRPRIVRRRIRVDGHWYVERIVVLPHTVRRTNRRVRFGASTSVSGWVGTAQGVALGGQTVQILAAADDGLGRFTPVGVATTAADGSWTALLPAGPSRILQAVYPGSATVEPSTSQLAHIIVPASLHLSVRPRATHWGSTIAIAGHLRGGHVPPAGELVVLRIGWAGGSTEVGHLYTARDGKFRTTYTFLRGNGTVTYHLWAETASETDYPFAVGSSKRIRITVGPQH
jgi:hypothetical protein